MNKLKKIIAICGSTKANSSNLKLIHAIAALSKGKFEVSIFRDLASIPHFNPELDTQEPPAEVVAFRNILAAADGILICTPEYAMGVPGSLKNVIDWTVSSMEFSQKPTALITASSMGQKGHASLLETLEIIEAKITEDTQLLIPFINAKINAEGSITDNKTVADIVLLIEGFENLIDE